MKRMTMVGLAVKEQVNKGVLDKKGEAVRPKPTALLRVGHGQCPTHMTGDVKPVTQKLRPIPVSMIEPLNKKLDVYVQEGVIEGPLGADQATGWVHNVFLTGGKWDSKAVA